MLLSLRNLRVSTLLTPRLLKEGGHKSKSGSPLAITMMVMTECISLSKVEMSDADRIQVKTIKIRADNRLPAQIAYYGQAHAAAPHLVS